MVVGVLLFEVDLVLAQSERSTSSPWDEAQVGVCAFVTNKIVLAFQNTVQDPRDTLDFVGVALNGRWKLLLVEIVEPESFQSANNGGFHSCKGTIPSTLPKIRALAGHLEHEPLLDIVFLGRGCVC